MVPHSMRNGLVLAGLALVLAQSAGSQPRVSSWRDYRAADGLAENASVAVSVGRHGKVWVAHSRAGLISGLDGYSVTNLAAPGAFTGKVYESPGGQLWVASSSGLEEYRNERWTEYAVPEIAAAVRKASTNGAPIVPLCPVRTGHIIFLLPDALMQLDLTDQGPVVSTLVTATNTRLEQFTGMIVSPRDDTIWIAGRRGLMRALSAAGGLRPDSEWSELLPPDSLRVTNLRQPVEGPDGQISVIAESSTGSQRIVLQFDGQNWTAQPAGNEKIRLAWRGPDKTSWVATADALFQVEGEKEQTLSEENHLGGEYFDVAVEPGGSFWLATSDGLFRYSPPTWQSPEGYEAADSPVQAITKDAEGRLWFAGQDSLTMLQGNHWARFPCPTGIRLDAAAPAIYALGDGSIVLQGDESLLQFNRSTAEFKTIAGPAKSRLRAVGLLNDGTLCVQASESRGENAPLQAFDGTNIIAFPFLQPPAELGNDLTVIPSAGGGFWIAGSRCIARYQDQKWQTNGPPGQSTPERVAYIAEGAEGRIWCATQEKIWEFNGKSWSLVLTATGKINALLAARDGSVWTATDNGMYRFHRQAGIQNDTEAWIQNDTEEGLPSESVLAVAEDASGQIWAGTARGVSRYDPKADPDPPQAHVVTQPGTDNSFPENSPVTLTLEGQDKWKFTPASRLLFSYQVDGKDWSPYQEKNTAPLSQLSAGEHYFQVRCMDRNGNVDVKRPFAFTFTVVLPWYKEARLLLISGAGGVIIIFLAGLAINRHLRLMRSHAEVEAQVALRTKQLEIANQELLHSQKMNALGTLAAGIAHDFNSILSIIKGSAQIIEDNLDNPGKIRTRAERINTVVEQGAGIVKAMLGFSRGSGGEVVMCDVNAIVGETVKLLGDRFLREVEVRFEPERSLPKVPASPDFVQQILLNLIFNAAEAMTGRRQIILSVRQTSQLPPVLVLAPTHAAQYVFIAVKDTGSGIAPDILPRIFEPFFTTKSLSARRGTGLGLSMVYELARQMEAGLTVESALNAGSTFTLMLPVRELPVDAAAEQN